MNELEIQQARLNRILKRDFGKVAIILEGRDTAGKTGTIRTLTHYMPIDKFSIHLSTKPSQATMNNWFRFWTTKLDMDNNTVNFAKNNSYQGSLSISTTKGDIFAATAANTVTRLAAGANGKVLKADSGESTGLAWADAVLSVTGTANEVDASTSSGAVTVGLPNDITIAGILTLDSIGIAAVQSSSESFANNDTSIMTSAAIEDKILAYSYAADADLTTNNVKVHDVETMFHMEVMV